MGCSSKRRKNKEKVLRKWKKPTAQIFLKRESNRKNGLKVIFGLLSLMGILYSGIFVGDKLNEFIEDNNRVVRENTEEQYIRSIRELKSYNESLESQLAQKESHKVKVENVLLAQHKRIQMLNLLLTELEKAKNKEESFGIAFSEGRFKRNVIHPSAPNRVVGMGGVDLVFWGSRLKKNGIDPKGLLAIDYIYTTYLKETSSEKQALEAYKGTIKNRYSYNLTKTYINILRDNHHFDKMLDAHKTSKKLLNQL